MKLVTVKNVNNQEVAINVEHIRAFYPYRNSEGITSTSQIEVDIGSIKNIIIKSTMNEFKSKIKRV